MKDAFSPSTVTKYLPSGIEDVSGTSASHISFPASKFSFSSLPSGSLRMAFSGSKFVLMTTTSPGKATSGTKILLSTRSRTSWALPHLSLISLPLAASPILMEKVPLTTSAVPLIPSSE